MYLPVGSSLRIWERNDPETYQWFSETYELKIRPSRTMRKNSSFTGRNKKETNIKKEQKIMFEEMTEQQAREQILEMTKEYCEKYHNQKKPYEKGDRIPYASRVYDGDEMVNLVDSSLEFWLTAGRFTKEFESGIREISGGKILFAG